MLFDEFDRGVIILGNANDGHIGVGRQCRETLSRTSRESSAMTTEIGPLTLMPSFPGRSRSLNHDHYSKRRC
jgi:hypothetical protein